MKILPSLAVAMATGPVLLGVTSAQAHGRRVVVVRPASGTTRTRPLPLSSGVRRIANAQLLPDTTAQAVDVQGDSLTIALGDVVLLPFSSVTRIITEDDEIARAFFQNGSPVLQGVALGTTTVEIYQASNSPRVLTITVVAKGSGPVLPIPTSGSRPAAPRWRPGGSSNWTRSRHTATSFDTTGHHAVARPLDGDATHSARPLVADGCATRHCHPR